jgi:hypothetical protein
MQSARYFRDQAVLCLEIAWQMSDPHAAAELRAVAADHFEKASELERTELLSSAPVNDPHGRHEIDAPGSRLDHAD